MDDDLRAARYSDLFASGHDHASDCSYCPICTAISLVRRTRPEVVDHLAAAAREFLAAATLILEEAERVIAAPEPAAPPTDDEQPANVRHMDVG